MKPNHWEGKSLLLALLLIASPVQAAELDDLKKEMEVIKQEVRELKEKEIEVRDDVGHRLHPVRSLMGVTITGGLTGIAQGSLNNENRFGGDSSEGSMSADLIFEAGMGEQTSFLLRFDVVQGEGLGRTPPLFSSPNGNTMGTNNDVEGFNEPRLNINEARFEHSLNSLLTFALGQIDLTSYFDENNLANDETIHYLAQQFDNNPAIEWGGSENFFGPGVVLKSAPAEFLDFSFGYFEGDGDYQKMFARPFLIGQAVLKVQPGGREGSYRLYGWGRLTPHCRDVDDSSVFVNCGDPASPGTSPTEVRIKGHNSGVGVSLDQQVSDGLGLWARLGYQDPEVSQFDKSVGVGAMLTGLLQEDRDALGLAYGAVFPSNDYDQVFQQTHGRGLDAEHYAEVYYRYVVFGDESMGLHITPDIQVVGNPGGDSTVDPVFIWGLRSQVTF